MLNQYAAVGIFFLLTLVFPVGAMATAWLFRPKPPETEAKLSVYECGVDAIGRAWHRYRVNYFRYTLIFLAMDVAIRSEEQRLTPVTISSRMPSSA